MLSDMKLIIGADPRGLRRQGSTWLICERGFRHAAGDSDEAQILVIGDAWQRHHARG